MFRFLAPKSIRPPFARYSHGVEVPAGRRLVLCSGQLGIGPDDSVPDDAGAQAELCFANIAAVLARLTGRIEQLPPILRLKHSCRIPRPSGRSVARGFSQPRSRTKQRVDQRPQLRHGQLLRR